MSSKPILIGIAGGTGSGKTSIAKAIAKEFTPQQVALIFQDSYYHDLAELSEDKRKSVNFDHPDAMDFELVTTHIRKLLNGEEIQVPVYDFSKHTRTKETLPYQGQKIIVLEGILALYKKELCDLMDIKIFVDTPDDIRILRRISRDISERGRTFECIADQYNKTVRPMHIEFVEPTKRCADIIIPEGSSNTVAVDILKTKLRDLLTFQKHVA
jgi:uridine kinase